MFRFLENALASQKIESRIINHASPQVRTLPQVLIITSRLREITHPPRQRFSKISFPKRKKEEDSVICFIKILSENMTMTWNIRLFIFHMISNFFKSDDVTVF